MAQKKETKRTALPGETFQPSLEDRLAELEERVRELEEAQAEEPPDEESLETPQE